MGVKAEVEKAASTGLREGFAGFGGDDGDGSGSSEVEAAAVQGSDRESGLETGRREGEKAWVETSIEIPGQRDDDPLPIFLAGMLNEALLARGELEGRLAINNRFHWRLYVDVCVSRLPFQNLDHGAGLSSIACVKSLLACTCPDLCAELQ